MSTPTLVTAIWREAARHLELAEAVLHLYPLLGAELPLGALVVRKLDLARRSVEALARAPSETDDGPPGAPAPDEVEALLAWCRSGALEHAPASALRRRLPGL